MARRDLLEMAAGGGGPLLASPGAFPGASAPGLAGATPGSALGPAVGGVPGLAGAIAASSAATETGGVATADPPARDERPLARSGGDAVLQTAGRLGNVIDDAVEVFPGPLKVLVGILAATVLALGGVQLVTALRARRLNRQRAALLEDIGLLQAAILPDVPDRLGDLAVSVAYRPAEGPGAGGDFYDAFALDEESVAIIVGDVSGHGRHALGPTTAIRHTIRAYLEAGDDPRQALETAGRVLERTLEEDFATVIVAVHDAGAGTLTYASAGHAPPIVVGGPGFEGLTACSAPPLGVGLRTGLRQTVLPFPAGVAAVFVTDGLAEARTPDGRIGPQRLAAMARELGPGLRAGDLLDRVAAESAPARDDMAVCVINSETGAAGALEGAGSERVEELVVEPFAAERGGAEAFLLVCGVPARLAEEHARRVRLLARRHGRVLVRVTSSEGAEPSVEASPDVHRLLSAAG